MTNARALLLVLAIIGCKNKEQGGGSSGLAWTPMNYDKMSAPCKKALACCLEIAKAEGAKSAEDFNGKCSGPALWKDADCETDLKARLSMFDDANKPAPEACK